MGEEQKELVRLESFWIDTWLRKNYEGIESRYIVHDVSAKEVDKHTFYHLREDGGTKISSAFRVAKQLLESHYSPDEWNIYLFHFSDGDNSSEADSRECVKLLKEQLLPTCNMFGLLPGRQRLRLGQLHQRPARAPAQPGEGAHQPRPIQRTTSTTRSRHSLAKAIDPLLLHEEEFLARHFSVGHCVQPHLVHLNPQAGFLHGHVVVKLDDELLARHERPNGFAAVDFVIVHPTIWSCPSPLPCHVILPAWEAPPSARR